MSNLSVAFKAAVHQFLIGRGLDPQEVLHWFERTDYCDTCASTEVQVDITYTDMQDEVQTYQYYGRFSELLMEY